MNFEVNGENYFLTLGENQGQWLVYVSTPDGPRPVPVYEDLSEFSDLNLVLQDKKRRSLVN
jgi:hypothetical protein